MNKQGADLEMQYLSKSERIHLVNGHLTAQGNQLGVTGVLGQAQTFEAEGTHDAINSLLKFKSKYDKLSQYSAFRITNEMHAEDK